MKIDTNSIIPFFLLYKWTLKKNFKQWWFTKKKFNMQKKKKKKEKKKSQFLQNPVKKKKVYNRAKIINIPNTSNKGNFMEEESSLEGESLYRHT
jgi:hypothetical protein